jgi:hypothetical protein
MEAGVRECYGRALRLTAMLLRGLQGRLLHHQTADVQRSDVMA